MADGPQSIQDLPRFDPIADPAFWQDPYPAFAAALEEEAPLHGSAFGVVVALQADVAAEIARDPRFGVAGAREAMEPLGLGDAVIDFFSFALLSLNPPVHTTRKKLVRKHLNPETFSKLESLVQRTVDELIDRMLEEKEFDFLSRVAGPLARRTLRRVLEVPAEDEPQLEKWTGDLAVGVKLLPTPEDNQSGGAASIAITDYLHGIALARLTAPGDDLMSAVVTGFAEQDEADPAGLAARTVGQVLFDGVDTVKHMLGNGLHTLLTHREAWRALREDPSRLAGAIDEMLRFQTSAFLTARRPMEDVVYRGVALPAGMQIALLWGAANRDPRRFENPNAFDINRRRARHQTFGGGAHFCAGAGLARLQLSLFFKSLLERVGDIELTSDTLRWSEYQLTRGLAELPVRVAAQ